MYLSRNWINEYVDINETPKELGLRLTMATAEIEGIEEQGDDILYDIDNKSLTHRPDLWGHYGFSREVAAIYKRPLKAIETQPFEAASETDALKVSSQVSAELCPRYNALTIQGIEVGPSPDWMVERLEALGARSVNNIVDLTNYILYELGQPLHAFDRKKIKGDTLQVRLAHEGEEIKTLDGGEYTLSSEMLVIADAENATAIAGVMGGAESEVDESTQVIVLESANFHPTEVRRCAHKLGIRTESSMRFEKGLDPLQTELAVQRFWTLLKQICPKAEVVGSVHDIFPSPAEALYVESSAQFINHKLGTDLSDDEIHSILERLGFDLQFENQGFRALVPHWRATGDISIPEDLVEEVGRVFGYDNIEPKAPEVPLTPTHPSDLHQMIMDLRQLLSASEGFAEVYNYGFVGEELLKKVGVDSSEHIALANPLASDHNLMRRSLVPNMLKTCAENLRFRSQFKIYEVERVFDPIPDLESGFEHEHFEVCALIADKAWKKGQPECFLSAKGILESILKQLPIQGTVGFAPPPEGFNLPAYCHPGRTAVVSIGGSEVGFLCQLHPQIAFNMGIKAGVSFFVLNLNELLSLPKKDYVFEGVQRYPTVPFDISLICPERALIADVEKVIFEVDQEKVRSVELFDIYQGDNMQADQKSLAFKITFAAKDHTLGPDEITALQTGVMDALDGAGYHVRKGE